jgi:hypothetical protein
MDFTNYLTYGGSYCILNGYAKFSGGGYLDVRGERCNDNLLCVSTRWLPPDWSTQKDGHSMVWKILSAEGKPDWSHVMANDVIYLQNQYPYHPDAMGGYLDTRGGGCQDNHLCVSTSVAKDRESGTGRWKIQLTEAGGEREVPLYFGAVGGSEVHLLNGWNNWTGGYLDTRGEKCQDNLLCVSTHKTWNGQDDPLTTLWKFLDVH